MKLKIASAEDSLALSDFFKQFPMGGQVEVKIDRHKNFFKAYDTQADKHITYTLRDDQDTIQGMASFLVTDLWIEGAPTTVAIGRDLRIANNRRAILSWGQHFLPVMNEVVQMFNCKHVFSILNLSEMQALNAFVRPRQLKRPIPRYFMYRRFNIVSVHGRLPLTRHPLPHLRIRRGSTQLEDALINYISKKSRQKDLATAWDQQSFQDKLERWEGLKLGDFLIALDRHDNIVGCTAPWSAGGIEDFVPLRYNLLAHNFRQFLKFGHLFGWTRPLTKPANRLIVEDTLNFRYLNFLNADNEDIFESLLWAAYEDAHQNEFLVYTQMRSEFHLRRPLGWVSGKIPFGLYCLVAPDQDPPGFLHPTNERHAELEPFFI